MELGGIGQRHRVQAEPGIGGPNWLMASTRTEPPALPVSVIAGTIWRSREGITAALPSATPVETLRRERHGKIEAILRRGGQACGTERVQLGAD